MSITQPIDTPARRRGAVLDALLKVRPGALPFPGRTEPDVLGRLCGLEVRLAVNAAEVRAAQALRYRIFHEREGARPNLFQRLTRRDEDRFDRHCDHLLLIDPARGRRLEDKLVGTYRLLTEDAAERADGFYGEAEFRIADLLARHPGRRFLELGRSCALPDYRGRRTVELLWHGIWAYVRARRIDVLFGCASLPGTSAEALTGPLSLLRRAALAPEEWRAEPVLGRGQPLPDEPEGDLRAGLAILPPLLKGYLRLGGMVSGASVVDAEFGTTDVFVVLPVERIASRYLAHYGGEADRFA